MKLVLDTSYLSALLNSNDLHNEEALTKWRDISSLQLYVPRTVILELLNFFHKVDNVDLIRFVDYADIKVTEIDAAFTKDYKLALKSTTKKVSTIDLTVIATALKHHCKVITFDKKLQQISSEVLQPQL